MIFYIFMMMMITQEWHLYVTGHSLGGALATLATLDHRRRYPTANVTMYNFGSPRVGNR